MIRNEQARNQKEAFAIWFERVYLTWQAGTGKRATLQEFADHIGYSRPLISMWLGGQRLPSADGVKRLAELFGSGIYDVLDLPRPDPDLVRLNQIWYKIPEKAQKRILEQGERYATENDETDIQPIKTTE